VTDSSEQNGFPEAFSYIIRTDTDMTIVDLLFLKCAMFLHVRLAVILLHLAKF